MTQFSTNAFATESVSHLQDSRRTELENQHWSRRKSQSRANRENILLSDEHWKVLIYLRQQYLDAGLPRHARYLASALVKDFAARGGTKYLHHLFPGGPITQGSRLANIPAPSDSTDPSHGSCY